MPSFFRIHAILFFLFFPVCFASFGFCTELVQVHRELQPEQSAIQLKDELMQEGFVLGVMSVAGSLLETPIGPERRELLASYLEPYVQRLIISYSDLGLQAGETPVEVVQQLEVTVDIQALKKILKKTGIFQTCTRPVRYFLKGENIPTEQIHNLEIFYGLEQVQEEEYADVVLSLRPSASFGFEASLLAGAHKLTTRPARFEQAWENIWEQYFALPDLALQGTSVSSIWLKGWANSAEVYAFDKQLRSWAKLIDSVQLEFLQLSAHQTQAFWSVRSTNDKRLQEKIEVHLALYPHLQLVYEDSALNAPNF